MYLHKMLNVATMTMYKMVPSHINTKL